MTEYYNAWIIDNCDKLVQAKKNIKVSVVFKDDNDLLELVAAILISRRSLSNSLFLTNKKGIHREFSVNYQSILSQEQINSIKNSAPVHCAASQPSEFQKQIATPETLLFSPLPTKSSSSSSNNKKIFGERTESFAEVGAKTLQHFKAQVMPEIESVVRKSLHPRHHNDIPAIRAQLRPAIIKASDYINDDTK